MKTKQLIGLLVFLLAELSAVAAQDMIIMRDGNVIEARVTEISSTEIRYRRFDFLDGPIFVVPVANVLSIRFEGGTVQTFNQPATVHAAPAAQPRSQRDGVRINWFLIDTSILGGGTRWEHDISDTFSVGLLGFWNGLPLEDRSTISFGGLITTRFYPGASPFYFELGMGIGEIRRWRSDRSPIAASGFMLNPAMGFRLGGHDRSFFANPFISVPMAFGARRSRSSGSGYHITPVIAAFIPGLGFGWAW